MKEPIDMTPTRFVFALVPVAICMAACGSSARPPAAASAPPTVAAAPAAPAPAEPPVPAAPPSPPPEVNPLLEPSPLPFHLPPFDKIKDADYAPAFEAGMAEQRKEIDAIAHAAEPPTFDNTIVALERTGRTLTRVEKAFFNLNASNTDDAMEKTESEMAPRLSAHQDAILLDASLFARIDAVYQHRGELGLDPESAQLLERYEDMFVRAGARLADADKVTLKKFNEELSSLSTRFRQNVLAATKDGGVVVDDVGQLDGLSQEQIGAAAEAAKARGLEGKWLISLQNTTIQPPLAQMKNRELRKRVFHASVMRGRGGSADNAGVVSRIVELRARKAALLGFPTFAAMALAEETAGSPAAVNRILDQLAPVALAKARDEAASIQAQIRADAKAANSAPFELAPWDWAFYAQEVRKARFSFDDAQVKPYFEMNRVLQDGVFFAAHELYGLSFTERHDLPVYQPDVRVFEVRDADGSTIGLLLLDYFKRDNKQGGAWMETFVDQSELFGDKPVVINNLNVPKPAPGEPARPSVVGQVPALVRPQRPGGLRRVPVAVQRDVVARAGRGGALRAALPDRRAAAQGAARQDRRRPGLRPGLRDAGVPRGVAARSVMAPDPARRGAASRAGGGVRGRGARPAPRRVSASAAALSHDVLLARVRRRLRGRLLRVHLERGARARRRSLVPRSRRAVAHGRRRVPRQDPVARPDQGAERAVRRVLRPPAGHQAAARVPRPEAARPAEALSDAQPRRHLTVSGSARARV